MTDNQQKDNELLASEDARRLLMNEDPIESRGDPLWALCILKEQRSVAATGLFALVVSAAVNFRTGPMFRTLIDNPEASGKLLSSTAVIFGVGAIASCIRTTCFDSMEIYLRNRLSLRTFKTVLRIRGETKVNNVGAQLGLIRDDAATVATFWTTTVQNGFRYLASILGGSTMCFVVNKELASYTLPIVFFASYKAVSRQQKAQSKRQNKLLEAQDKVMNFAESRLQQGPTIRAFNAVGRETEAMEIKLCEWGSHGHKSARSHGLMMGTFDVIIKGIMMTLVYAGGRLIKKNHLTGGELSQFILHASMTGMGLLGFLKLFNDLSIARVSASRIVAQEHLASIEERKESLYTVKTTEPAEIEFKNVTYKYPNEENNAVEDISFKLKAGSNIGIVGESGSGKSTIMGLLSGELSPTSGDIFINGKKINQSTNQAIRDFLIISWVPQTPILFGPSVSEAIKLRGNETTGADLNKALNDADAASFLRNDVDTDLESLSFSGGEVARLCLARAFYGSSALLLLDEPCSGLDKPTAMNIVKSSFAQKATCILATHGLWMLENADHILVLADGKLKEQNSYKALMQRNTEFNRLLAANK